MIPDDIVRMLAAGPGKYAVFVPPDDRRYIMVEVDYLGLVHQLTPGGKRDGALSMEGWNPKVRVFTVSEDGLKFVRIGHPTIDTEGTTK